MGIREMSEMIYNATDFSELYQLTLNYGIDYEFQVNLKDHYDVDILLESEPGYGITTLCENKANFIDHNGKPISLDLAIHVALETLIHGIMDDVNFDQNDTTNNKIEIYIDGAAPNNQDMKEDYPVSWAYIIKWLTSNDIEKTKVYTGRTNNDMELSGFIEVMKYLEQQHPDTLSGYNINVFSDSNYLVNNYNHYLDGWKNNDWRKSNNKPLINLDKWKEIYRLKSIFSKSKLSLIHVSGHKNNVGNNRADKLANEAIANFIAHRD